MRRRLRQAAALAALASAAAVAGGAAAIAVGKAAGWLGGETVVLEAADAARPPDGPVAERPQEALPGDAFDPAAIYRERSAGVVTIYALFPGNGEGEAGAEAQGSGFVVSAAGYVLTNSHVITTSGGEQQPDGEVEPATEIFVEFGDGDRAAASIVGWDLFDDVGLVKVDPDAHSLSPVPLGDSSRVLVGEPVAAIGSPFGQAGSLAVGVVSATERAVSSLTSVYSLVDAIQTDAAINRGNSGGPLFNARGEVIGINAQIRSESGSAEGVGFAIPINSARRSMEQLIELGRVRYAWVGGLHPDADAFARPRARLSGGRRRCDPGGRPRQPGRAGGAAGRHGARHGRRAEVPGGRRRGRRHRGHARGEDRGSHPDRRGEALPRRDGALHRVARRCSRHRPGGARGAPGRSRRRALSRYPAPRPCSS